MGSFVCWPIPPVMGRFICLLLVLQPMHSERKERAGKAEPVVERETTSIHSALQHEGFDGAANSFGRYDLGETSFCC